MIALNLKATSCIREVDCQKMVPGLSDALYFT